MSSEIKRIEEIIAPTLTDLGYAIVRLQMQGDRHQTLQIMAERLDRKIMDVDDCAKISRAISPLLDVDDPIEDPYSLEVSSPGVDRPLVRAEDFERFAGFEAKVEMSYLIDGRKRFTGRLVGLVDGNVQILVDGVAQDLPFEDVVKAKLVLTDDLLAAASKEQGL
ncbi:Ribosome maturation factor RimP [Candidatus Terasakiella magnetica]|uniref:Ribosome maturation factor RimP n=1 Tax=Candidatus Terasakiella magnetica TaxID=1867952 RepID=A0A1C3RE86_9PROT|nr:ribosome maturation factor RimP [Candidatus Terasakiella magnetica]SCA55606.1 Ribosome maturation factor RimP [Candidatus Terasakiella magnetica]